MLKLFEVRFQLANGSIFKSVIPAYTNGGAENMVLDVLRDRCARCQAFDADDFLATDDFDDEDPTIAETLYPGAQLVDCTLIATL